MQRRKDVERRRKEKKIQWLQKMYQKFLFYRSFLNTINSYRYKTGLGNQEKNDDLTDNGHGKEMSHLINETTESMLRIFNTYGASAVQDYEVNELLKWTHNLNFDEYSLDWRTIGTTAASNAIYGMS
jgi:hypothetical protein